MVRITCLIEGFRRGGIAHAKGTVEHPDSTFTKAQLAQLQGEPNLVVEIVEDKKDAKKEEKK